MAVTVMKGLSPQTHLLWCFILPLSWLQPGAMQHACLVGRQLTPGGADLKLSFCLLKLCDETKAEFIYCLQRQHKAVVFGQYFCYNLASYLLCDCKPDFFQK